MAVFGIPSGMLALNVGLWFMLQNDPKNTHLHKSLLAIGQWTIPVLSLLTNGITFLNALSQPRFIKIKDRVLIESVAQICLSFLFQWHTVSSFMAPCCAFSQATTKRSGLQGLFAKEV